MYTPPKLRMDEQAIAPFLAAYPFATLITPDMQASHIPLVYRAGSDGLGCLYGHLAKANPQAKVLQGQRVLTIFHGPHDYISPRWYVSQPAVPTWNYAAVHCYGRGELLSKDEDQDGLDKLIRLMEPELLTLEPGQPGELDQEYNARLARAITGFRIELDTIEAKEKLGQHKPPQDQRRVHEALQQKPDTALADYMSKRGIGIGQMR